jgi:hypothetical protein
MSDTQIPTEVELVFEAMPCNAQRVAQEPTLLPHPCSYFRKWGTYHSYDYPKAGPPATPNILQAVQYVGRAPPVPEMLSGCRKAPILSVGINPNLPGWWPATRGSLNPVFDDYKQYAHYFRYRETAKLELSPSDYKKFGGGDQDVPPASTVELNVPMDSDGFRTLSARLQQQKMYQAYQALLDDLAKSMKLPAHKLAVGEDLAYANMIACPSAKWTTQADAHDPNLPPMSEDERKGIVHECFETRKYFLRSLFQSLPSVLLVFSQSTANAFIGQLNGAFSSGDPKVDEPVAELLGKQVILKYGELPHGKLVDAEVIFAPHPTGDPTHWAKARPKVIEKLQAAAQAGRFAYRKETGHLSRTQGSCVFCTMLEIGKCDYLAEIKPLSPTPSLTAVEPAARLIPGSDKTVQNNLLNDFVAKLRPRARTWHASEMAHDASTAKRDS